MFSGKTRYMIGRLRRALAEGKLVRAFKHVIDDRYAPDHLVSHNDDRFEELRAGSAEAIVDLCNGAELVAIDEGQFFGTPLIGVSRKLLDDRVAVMVAGISNDAWGRPFDPMPQLAEMADEVITLEAPCSVCGAPSPYTQRMKQVNTQHMVGGLDEYEPRCAAHFEPLPGPPEQR